MNAAAPLSPIVPLSLWETLRAAGYLIRGVNPEYYWACADVDGLKRQSPERFATPHLCALDAQRDMVHSRAWVQPALFKDLPLRYIEARA